MLLAGYALSGLTLASEMCSEPRKLKESLMGGQKTKRRRRGQRAWSGVSLASLSRKSGLRRA